MWDPLKTSKLRLSIMDALRVFIKKIKVEILHSEIVKNNESILMVKNNFVNKAF